MRGSNQVEMERVTQRIRLHQKIMLLKTKGQPITSHAGNFLKKQKMTIPRVSSGLSSQWQAGFFPLAIRPIP
jgi:hypothetical protein